MHETLTRELVEVANRIRSQTSQREADARVSLTIQSASKIEELFRRAAAVIEELERLFFQQETQMGRAAQAISQLESELATASANAYDSADIAAINAVLTTSNTSSGATSNASSGATTPPQS